MEGDLAAGDESLAVLDRRLYDCREAEVSKHKIGKHMERGAESEQPMIREKL